MRITRIDVGAFGAMRGRTFHTDHGLVLFHGPNESGKTTVMEFVRNTLVPTSKRDVYPVRGRGDHGSVTVVDAEGEHVIVLEGRRRGGDVPDAVSGLDPVLYRSVFALNQRDLEDDGPFARGELRSRSLTVPGGDAVPGAMEALTAIVDAELGRTASSRSRLAEALRDLDSVESRIAELRPIAESYGEVAARRDEVRGEIESAESELRSAAASRRMGELAESNAGNYGRLEELEGELSSMGVFRRVHQGDIDLHAGLREAVGAARAALDAVESERDRCRRTMGGVDERAVRSSAPAMTSLLDRYPAYMAGASGADVRGGTPVMVLAGLLLAAAGAVGSTATPYALVASAAGVVLAVVGLVRRRRAGRRRPGRDGAYEGEVASVMASLGLQPTSVPADIRRMEDLLSAQRALSASEPSWMRCRSGVVAAEEDMRRFYQPYGGERGYAASIELTERAIRIESEIGSIRGALSRSGLDPDADPRTVMSGDVDDGRLRELVAELGRLEERMSAMMDTGELDSLLDRRSALRGEVLETVRRGSTAVLALHIADRACGEEFGGTRSSVLSAADRYLSMMTGGEHRIDMDPLGEEVSVVSGGRVRGPREWSTGLRAQVMLSVKLALAREMGGGEVPVILDDVLLPFDRVRMEGACRALVEASREMQLLVFTCDDRVVGMLGGMDGVGTVEL